MKIVSDDKKIYNTNIVTDRRCGFEIFRKTVLEDNPEYSLLRLFQTDVKYNIVIYICELGLLYDSSARA